MVVEAEEPCPWPTDPFLADVATAATDAGQAAMIVDHQWRFVHGTDVARPLWVDTSGGRRGSVAIGHHLFSAESLRIGRGWRFGWTTTELWRELLRSVGGMVLADTEGGPDELRRLIDPSLHDVVDELVPCHTAAHAVESTTTAPLGDARTILVVTRVRPTRRSRLRNRQGPPRRPRHRRLQHLSRRRDPSHRTSGMPWRTPSRPWLRCREVTP